MRDLMRRGDRSQPRPIGEAAPLPGVIDTVGLGYAALVSRPLIVVPPIILDLYLWLGLRITARPITYEAAQWTRSQGSDWRALSDEIEHFERFNVFETLSLRLPTFRMPTLVPILTTERLDEVGRTFEFGSIPWWCVIGIGIVAFSLGLLIGATWLLAMATVATNSGSVRAAIAPRVAVGRAVAIGGWIAAIVGLFVLISSPFLVGAILGEFVGFNGIGMLLLVLFFPVAWGYIFFYFSIQALILDRLGPLAALRSSYQVVRGFFWQSLRFIALSIVITTGIPFALRVFTTSAPGLVIAIIGNAFIASGMIAAAMLFYRDRARRLNLPAFAVER